MSMLYRVYVPGQLYCVSSFLVVSVTPVLYSPTLFILELKTYIYIYIHVHSAFIQSYSFLHLSHSYLLLHYSIHYLSYDLMNIRKLTLHTIDIQWTRHYNRAFTYITITNLTYLTLEFPYRHEGIVNCTHIWDAC